MARSCPDALAAPTVKPTMSAPAVVGLLLVNDTRENPFGPELASVFVTAAVTPTSFEFAGPIGLGVTATEHTGAVLSMRIDPKNAGGFAVLPAASRQPPTTPLVIPAAVTVIGLSVCATPDWLAPMSEQANVTTTSWFVHVPAVYETMAPLAFVVVADAVAIGSVRSMSIPAVAVPNVAVELFPAESTHVPWLVAFVTGPSTWIGGVSVAIWLPTAIGTQENDTVTVLLVHTPAV